MGVIIKTGVLKYKDAQSGDYVGFNAVAQGESASANVPASASASGVSGQVAYDSNYIYVCVATNTWKRAALTTW